jgi:hypothetical protein
MREWTPQSHLEEAFRKVLFRLVNQYLSFPEDVTHGKIVRTLVAFQQARAALEGCAGTLVLRTSSEENCHPHGRGTKPGQGAKGKFRVNSPSSEARMSFLTIRGTGERIRT